MELKDLEKEIEKIKLRNKEWKQTKNGKQVGQEKYVFVF